jgi:DNA-binding transcriptional MerR regulator
MATFTVGEVAIMLGVSPSTIRNHTQQDELQTYLSDLATRRGQYKDAKERRYTMEDVVVINTARVHKTHSTTWADVVSLLAEGERERNLPETAALVMPETKADAFQLVTAARAQINMLQELNEELDSRLAASEQGRRDDVERLSKEQSELRETIGVLKFLLRMNGIDPETGKKKE